jgi:CRISPR system Cascade subunit CasD
MGVRREQETIHQHMATAYGFAVRVDATGILLRDYHTIQVPPERRKTVYYTRRDELNAETLNTILSSREYRCDALYTVALWAREPSVPFDLDVLVTGLQRPRFTLYLGRKSCPLALPVQALLITASNLEQAFLQARFMDDAHLRREETDVLDRSERALLYWEADADAGSWKPLQTIVRRDQLLSRRRWQFSDRREQQAIVDNRREE